MRRTSVLWLVPLALAAGCATATPGPAVLGGGPRPADACTLLTSGQVATIVGAPGRYTGAPEDPAADGSPVWGCTWDTQRSYADIRQLGAAQFTQATATDPDTVDTPLTGIGDRAVLTKNRGDGGNSSVCFTVSGRYYAAQVVVNRLGEQDVPNAGQEAAAGQQLAKTLLPRLSG